jgi:hypothetical protein
MIEYEQYPCATSLYPDLDYSIEEPLQNSYDIQVYYENDQCEVAPGNVNILNVQSGSQVEVVGEQRFLRYFPLSSDTADVIEYEVQLENETLNRALYIYFTSTDSADQGGGNNGNCKVVALNDFYTYYPDDSASTDIVPFVFDPVLNDTVCGDYSIDYFQQPDLGELELLEDQRMRYVVYEEFAGEMQSSFDYLLCDATGCDTATVNFTVIKE